MTEYLINFQQIKAQTINECIDFLAPINGLPIKDCKLSDLVFYQNKPIYSGNGVYIFRYKSRYIYVGNCVARNFVERIPAHFDVRKGGWFNSLLKNIIKKEWATMEINDEQLTKAAQYAFENFSLILINFNPADYSKEHINKLETLLKIALKPLNTFKHKRIGDYEMKVIDYLS